MAAVVLGFSSMASVTRLVPNRLSSEMNFSDFPRTIMYLKRLGFENENDFSF